MGMHTLLLVFPVGWLVWLLVWLLALWEMLASGMCPFAGRIEQTLTCSPLWQAGTA